LLEQEGREGRAKWGFALLLARTRLQRERGMCQKGVGEEERTRLTRNNQKVGTSEILIETSNGARAPCTIFSEKIKNFIIYVKLI
jgi:hypothetical protein